MGLSQERLAELLGITYQQIQKYERGANRIGAGRLFELARILDVPLDWFYEEFVGADAPGGAGLVEAGLAEAPAPFLFDGAAAPASTEAAVDRRETLELVRAFNRIGDPLVRRRLYELARALADTRWRGDAGAA
jgi:transcriptional regulator with XRE-family HTH domain